LIAAAERLAGLSFTSGERELMPEGLQHQLEAYAQIRSVALANSVPPALIFDPGATPTAPPSTRTTAGTIAARVAQAAPTDLEQLAFAPVTQLAELLRTRQISSVALTEMYLRRLQRYDPALECVVTLTDELALALAQRADTELAAGRYRGPLHGIPWGAKDLLATRGIRTTWGATPYQD